MNVFEAVKGNVTARQAAEMYGVQVSRHGMAVCPFHNDKNPSMKVDKRFHCFACQADGDAVDFVSRLFGLPGKEAASCMLAAWPQALPGLDFPEESARMEGVMEMIRSIRNLRAGMNVQPSHKARLMVRANAGWEEAVRGAEIYFARMASVSQPLRRNI